jgi:hypothetical protein
LDAGEALDHEPRSALVAQKKWRDRLIALALGRPEWVVGFEEEVWWSRLAQPNRQTWTDDKPLRLLQKEADRHDPQPKAVACYGLLRADTQGMLLRFVDGRPVSTVTTQCLEWLTDRLAAEGKTALLLVWDNASWHVSQAVRRWRKAHKRRGQAGRRLSHRGVPLAQQESLAASHRAQRGAWQAGHGRTESEVAC